jgi:KDO2-lipid IV(A) lauroyltransferase
MLDESLVLAAKLFEVLPRQLASQLAESALVWGSLGAPRARATVKRHLAIISQGSERNSDALVQEVFRSFGRYLAEFLTMHQEPQLCVRIAGQHHLEAVRRSGRGAVALTAHVGNWELGAALLQRYAPGVAVVVLPHRNPRVNQLFDRQRQRCGIRVIPLGPRTTRLCMRWLEGGGWLGMLGDLSFGSRSLQMELCGIPARVPMGPAWISLQARVPVVPMFLVREGRQAYRLAIEAPIEAGGGGRDAVETLTRRCAAVIERYVREFATQWLVFQPLDGSSNP